MVMSIQLKPKNILINLTNVWNIWLANYNDITSAADTIVTLCNYINEDLLSNEGLRKEDGCRKEVKRKLFRHVSNAMKNISIWPFESESQPLS